MGSLALPALDIKAPQQEDLLQKFAQLNQIKASQQQQAQNAAEAPLRMQALNQGVQSGQMDIDQKQQAVKNQQAITSAYKAWDGRDYADLAHLAVQNGATGDTAQTILQHGLEIRKSASAIAASDAKTGADNATTLGKQLDQAAGALQGVLSAPPEQMGQALITTAQQLAAQKRPDGSPLLDASHLQMAEQLAQKGPEAITSAIPTFAKSLTAFSAQLDAAAKQAQTKAENTAAAKNQMEIDRGGNTAEDKFISDYLKAKNLDNTPANRLIAFKEYTKETKIEPAQVRVESYAQTPTQVFDPSTGQNKYATRKDAIGQLAPSTAEAQAQKSTSKYFTSGKGGQQLTAFNTAIDHLKLLDNLARDLGNGDIQVFNKAAQSWATATGNPAPTNFEAAKNAMSGEVAAALKASGATDTEIAKVDSTFNKAQSPMQLKGAIATYRTLLNSKAFNLKKQYDQGMKAQPNFGDAGPASDPAAGGDPFAQFGGKAH